MSAFFAKFVRGDGAVKNVQPLADENGRLYLANPGTVATTTERFSGYKSLTHNTVFKVVFKDAAGNATVARRFRMRVLADNAAYSGKVHYNIFATDPGAGVHVDAEDIFLLNYEPMDSFAHDMAQLHLFSVDGSGGALPIKVWIEAVSDQDISGTTIA